MSPWSVGFSLLGQAFAGQTQRCLAWLIVLLAP
jgi:hypothetical protein